MMMQAVLGQVLVQEEQRLRGGGARGTKGREPLILTLEIRYNRVSDPVTVSFQVKPR